MSGSPVSLDSEKKTCSPDVTNAEMEKFWSVDGTLLRKDDLSYPCGLLSKYYPLDNFEFFDSGMKQVPVSKSAISWSGLKGNKFKAVNKSREWVDIESETFINWMRPNLMPHAYKAWGRFEQDVPSGVYSVRIYNGRFKN